MKKFSTLKSEKNGSGVYKIYNRNKKLVYVGRASNGNIKHHIVQHFGSKHYSGAKFGKRGDNYYSIKLLPKKKVKVAEKRFIRRLKPRQNRYKYKK